MRVSLPFQFQVGDMVLPSGNYFVVIDKQSRTLVVHNTTEYSSAAVDGLAIRHENDVLSGKLTFADRGNGKALTLVWLKGERRGYAIRMAEANGKAPSKALLTEIAAQ